MLKKKIEICFGKGRNIVGKGENAGYQWGLRGKELSLENSKEKEKLCLMRSFFLVFRTTGWRPESYCHGIVSVVRPSIRLYICPCVRPSVNFSFKKLLLRNYWLDFYQISQECSIDDPLLNSFKWLCSMKNSGCHGNQSKKPLKSSPPKPLIG